MRRERSFLRLRWLSWDRVEPFGRGALAGRGALLAVKKGGAALCLTGALEAKRGFRGFAVGQSLWRWLSGGGLCGHAG